MKKSFFTLSCMLLALTAFADINKRQEIFPIDFNGGGKTAATLNYTIARIKTADEATIVLTGGQWAIEADVTFPSNVNLRVEYGSTFYVDNPFTVTMTGVNFEAGSYVIFTGSGNAVGDANFIYRWPIWGDTTRFDIGDGAINESQVEEWIENGDLTFTNGSTVTFDKIVVNDESRFLDQMSLDSNSVFFIESGSTMKFQSSATNTFKNGSVLQHNTGSTETHASGSADTYESGATTTFESNSVTTFDEGAIINGLGFTNAVQAISGLPGTGDIDFGGYDGTNVGDIVLVSGVSLKSPYCFRADMGGAAQSIAVNTDVKINMTNEVFDIGDCYTATNSRFTPPVNGKYYLSYYLYTDGDETPETSWCKLFKNGVVDAEQGMTGQAASDDALFMNVAVVMDLTTNDYVEPYAYSSEDVGTTPIIPVEYQTFWSGFYIGE